MSCLPHPCNSDHLQNVATSTHFFKNCLNLLQCSLISQQLGHRPPIFLAVHPFHPNQAESLGSDFLNRIWECSCGGEPNSLEYLRQILKFKILGLLLELHLHSSNSLLELFDRSAGFTQLDSWGCWLPGTPCPSIQWNVPGHPSSNNWTPSTKSKFSCQTEAACTTCRSGWDWQNGWTCWPHPPPSTLCLQFTAGSLPGVRSSQPPNHRQPQRIKYHSLGK